MKKSMIILSFLLPALIFSFESGWENDKIIGRVKKRVIEFYKAPKDAIKGTNKQISLMQGKKVTQYNERGLYIEVASYNVLGLLKWKTVYQYGKQTMSIEYTFYKSGDPYFKYTEKYKYNKKNQEIEKTAYNAKGELTKKILTLYDKKGNKKKRVKYDKSGKLTWRRTFVYDQKGNNTEIRDVYPEFKRMNTNYSLKYDSRNRLVEKTSFRKSGKPSLREVFQYRGKSLAIHRHTFFSYNRKGILEKRKVMRFNSRGHWDRLSVYDPKNKLKKRTGYKYEYDENENTKKVTELEMITPKRYRVASIWQYKYVYY